MAIFRAIYGWDVSPETLYAPLQSGMAVQLPDGRTKRYEWKEDIVILDETYNAA